MNRAAVAAFDVALRHWATLIADQARRLPDDQREPFIETEVGRQIDSMVTAAGEPARPVIAGMRPALRAMVRERLR